MNAILRPVAAIKSLRFALLFAETMSSRLGKKYQQFERALQCFNPERIAALYDALGRHECETKEQLSKTCSQNLEISLGSEEWPLGICIQKNYIKSAFYLISLGLPREELNCGLEMVLTKRPVVNYAELIKTFLRARASVTSFVWFKEFVFHYQHKPDLCSGILHSLCSIPSDPITRYNILGMFLHYCCIGSCRCKQLLFSRGCIKKHRPDRSLFRITWYKTLEYLISEGLDLRSYKDLKVVEATRHYYQWSESLHSFHTCHIDTAVMSMMIRLATGSTLSRDIFIKYAQQISRAALDELSAYRQNAVSHEQDLLDLLPMFYQVGVDVGAPRCQVIFTGPRREQYSSYIAFVEKQPRSLRDAACLRVRLALSGPNVMISSRALTRLPVSLRETLMLKHLDITHYLEPESVVRADDG